MDAKLIRVGMVLAGIGGACVARAYGKYMYAKGVADTDMFYKIIMKAEHETIHTLLDKLKKQQEGSQK